MSPEIAKTVLQDIKPDPNSKYSSFILPDYAEADRVMRLYHYTRI